MGYVYFFELLEYFFGVKGGRVCNDPRTGTFLGVAILSPTTKSFASFAMMNPFWQKNRGWFLVTVNSLPVLNLRQSKSRSFRFQARTAWCMPIFPSRESEGSANGAISCRPIKGECWASVRIGT